MGLDITAYKKLIKANGNEAFDETGELIYEDDWVQFYKNSDFPNAANDIADKKAYKPEDEYNFRAGAYSGYGRWRNELAKFAGYESSEDVWKNHSSGDFFELICFSDCEGVIGSEVSKKLLADFEKWQASADQHESESFRSLYSCFKKAFSMASNEGAVEFH